MELRKIPSAAYGSIAVAADCWAGVGFFRWALVLSFCACFRARLTAWTLLDRAVSCSGEMTSPRLAIPLPAARNVGSSEKKLDASNAQTRLTSGGSVGGDDRAHRERDDDERGEAGLERRHLREYR